MKLIRKGGFFIASLLLIATSASFALEPIGKLEFQKNCAACHGMEGKGDGPFIEFLRQTPSDLTLIAKRNNGVFPQQEIYDKIADPTRSRGHGSQEMPIWGDRYREEIIERYGPEYYGPSGSVRGRILELVFYLNTIQQQ